MGVICFCMWVCFNLRVMWGVRTAARVTRSRASDIVLAGRTSMLQCEVDGSTPAVPQEVIAEIGTLRQSPRPFSSGKRRSLCYQPKEGVADTNGTAQLPYNLQERLSQAVALGVKVWIVSDIDVSTTTFECKFHVFMDWIDEAAISKPDEETKTGKIQPLKLCVRNAITVIMEDCSEPEVVNSETGHVACRIQYHLRIHNDFDLRSFPFDCQRLEIALELVSGEDGRFFVSNFCDIDDQSTHLDGWRFRDIGMSEGLTGSNIHIIVERECRYYVMQVLLIYFFLTTLLFSFFFMKSMDVPNPAKDFAKRMVHTLKIALTQTTFRFSVEQRLPKVRHSTPLDVYLVSCQLFCCLVGCSFITSAIVNKVTSQVCDMHNADLKMLGAEFAVWILWNVSFAIYAYYIKKVELRRIQLKGQSEEATDHLMGEGSPCSPTSLEIIRRKLGSCRPWENAEEDDSDAVIETQVVSIAFRIWLVRNVDLVRATFECKFRVFLEWQDPNAVGLTKGKKAKLPVPEITIANAVTSKVLDRSSAPEVVCSESGHLAAQILYRATLQMDQEVHLFPFDCQWLAITVGLREVSSLPRSFLFQYCEVDGQLQLDEWTVHDHPAFASLSKNEAPSIQDTVMCGVLITRCARYYVVNIMGMLCLISSLSFSVFTIDVTKFWERSEVFLTVFPLIIIFKMSAQAKLPRVGYSTKFDLYAISCQTLFLLIVLNCMTLSIITNLPRWIAMCPSTVDANYTETLRTAEKAMVCAAALIWVSWNAYFAVQAWRNKRLHPMKAVQTPVPIKTSSQVRSSRGSGGIPDVTGLAPRLSRVVAQEIASSVALSSVATTDFVGLLGQELEAATGKSEGSVKPKTERTCV